MSKYFYHGLGEIFKYENSLDKAFNILKNGGIQGEKNSDNLSTGTSHISIYKKLSDDEYKKAIMYKHAFSSVVENCFCFIISDEIDVIRPVRVPTGYNKLDLEKLRKAHQNRSFTEMCDEWQVRDSIPLSSIIGVGIPIRWINLHWKDLDQLERLGEFVTIAEKLGLDIVDTNDPKFVEEYEAQKQEKVSHVYVVSRKDAEE